MGAGKKVGWGAMALGVAALVFVGVTGSAGEATAPTRSAATTSATPLATPSASITPAQTPTPMVDVTLSSKDWDGDALDDPTLKGTVSSGAGTSLAVQTLQDGTWTTVADTTADADGAFSVALSWGHGQLRSDKIRVAAASQAAQASQVITVKREAVLSPSVRTVKASDVSKSWQEGCPVKPSELRFLDVNFYGFDGKMHRGTLVVAASAVPDMQALIQSTIDNRFPIRKMVPVDAYGADDEKSTADDNTAAFNCRHTPLGTYWSEHSYGTAIDINPVENPYNNGGEVIPNGSGKYLDRDNVREGMLTPSSPVVKYAQGHGWMWLEPIDYQHFELPH